MTPQPCCHRILVLGCGYVGGALTKRLTRDGFDIVATTTTRSRMSEIAGLGAAPTVLSLDDADRLHKALADRECVCFCVAAGRGGLRGRPDAPSPGPLPSTGEGDRKADAVSPPGSEGPGRTPSYRELYADGACRLIEACRDTPVRRILYTSSTRVYAQDDGSWVDEDSPTQPPDEDGQALVQAERRLLDARDDGSLPPESHVSVLRLGGIHGPGRELAGRFHQAAGSRRSDGDVYVNLVHLSDVVEVMVRLLGMNHQGIINVCDGRPTLRRELYDREIARAGLSPIQWTPPSGQARGKRVSIERLRQMPGLAPRSTG